MSKKKAISATVDRNSLPEFYPTHLNVPEFWEALGRAIATICFLEETLGKAVFALTATKRHSPSKIDDEYAKWIPTLETALSNPLVNRAELYQKAFNSHDEVQGKDELEKIVGHIKKLATTRNVLCHGSWQKPMQDGTTLPFFVNKNKEVCCSTFNVEDLNLIQRHALELACAVIDSVTLLGWEFPGGGGPGKPIYEKGSP